VTDCLAFLFIPDANYLNGTINNFKTNVSTHFPLGYITDFLSILSTSTEGTLTVIDATLPMLGGPHVHLSIANVLDPLLNATTSQFTNESAPSTDTFYEITSHYWNILVYIGTLLYLLGRILGSHLIPDFGGRINKQGGVGSKPYGPNK